MTLPGTGYLPEILWGDQARRRRTVPPTVGGAA